MPLEDLRSLPEWKKYELYEKLEREHHGEISTKAHSDGFPAVTINVKGKLLYITDCLSIETWWRTKLGLTHYVIFPPKGTGFSTSTKTLEEAKERAAEHFHVKVAEICEEKGWRIEDRGFNP